MTISDCMMVTAVILGPIIAVQVQKAIEKLRQSRQSKLEIFKTLMATRGTPMAFQHVQALNMIDLEFDPNKPKEKGTRDAWKVYLDHLHNAPQDLTDPAYQSKQDSWATKKDEYLTDLLFTMSQVLGYSFDKVQLKRGAYTPQGHAQIEIEQLQIRHGLVEILLGRARLPVEFVQRDPAQP